MECNHGGGEAEPRGSAAGGFVADDEPCRAWEAVVEDVGDDANVRVYIRGGNEAGIYVGHPELAERAVEGWEEKSADVEEEGAVIAAMPRSAFGIASVVDFGLYRTFHDLGN